MTGLYSEPIGNVAQQAQESEAYPASVWDSEEPFGASKQLLRGIGNAQARFGTVDEYGRQITPPEPSAEADVLNQKYGIDGHLKFDNPLPESVAQEMYQAKRDELARADAAARSNAGRLTRLGAGLVTGAYDPLNLAAAFMPGIGEARTMGWLARAGLDSSGILARTGARALAGGINAGAAQTPLVALRYGLSQQEQADYSASDAMADILMGSVLGGGLHTAIGGVGDVVGSRFGRSAMASLVERDPGLREATMRAAVAAVADDKPVNLAPVLDSTDLRSAYADRLTARGDTSPGNYAAYTPTGQRVELRPEIAELGDLTASNNPDGTINPAFPHEAGTQPRDRTSAASQAQIAELASRLEPERLGPSPEAAMGAPIVNGDGVVESGNGRVLALNKVYSDPGLTNQRAAYRAFLEAQGHDLAGVNNPVLIGRRVSDLAPDQQLAFVRGANERATLGLNTAEQARIDADRARQTNVPLADLLAQMDMLNRPSPAAEAFLRLMFRDDAMRQPVARTKLAQMLDRYVDQAMEARPGPGLFDEPETTLADIMRAIGINDAKMEGLASALDARPEPLPPEAPAEAPPPPALEGETHLATPDALAKIADQSAQIEAELNAMRSDEAPTPDLDQALEQIATETEKSQGILKGLQQAGACLIGGLA